MSGMKEIVIDVDQEEDEEDWDIGISTSFKQIRPGTHFGCNLGEEEDDDEYDDQEFEDYGGKVELGCPYCVENFDILGLCCHIDDQHYKEAKSRICPICDEKLDTNMTVHIITQHKRILKTLPKVKVRNVGTHSGLSRLKKEDHSCSHLKAPSPVVSSDLSLEPSFLSFAKTTKPAYRTESSQHKSPTEAPSPRKSSNCDTAERSIDHSSLTDKSQGKAQVCEFVSDLLFSTIFSDL